MEVDPPAGDIPGSGCWDDQMKNNDLSTFMVIGSTGALGTALVYYLRTLGHTVQPVSRNEFVIGQDPLGMLELGEVDWVVNAAGIINRRLRSDKDTVDAYLVNSLFPHLLADYCESKKVQMIHISTDCVFDGTNGPYTELDPPSASDLYGQSKSWGEPRNCLVLRTSFIGPEQNNFYLLLTWFLNQTGECPGYTNHLWNGLTTLQLGICIDKIVRSNLYEKRIQHVFGEDTTKFELLCKIARSFGHPVRVVPHEDVVSRDTRLRTTNHSFIEQLDLPGLEEQLVQLVPFCESLKKI